MGFWTSRSCRLATLRYVVCVPCSEIENGGGNDVIYEYDDFEQQRDADHRPSSSSSSSGRQSIAKSRDFSREFSRRRHARYRRHADYSARGDYQYPDESMMTSSSTATTPSRAPPGVRRANNGSGATSGRQMSLPTDPEVGHHGSAAVVAARSRPHRTCCPLANNVEYIDHRVAR